MIKRYERSPASHLISCERGAWVYYEDHLATEKFWKDQLAITVDNKVEVEKKYHRLLDLFKAVVKDRHYLCENEGVGDCETSKFEECPSEYCVAARELLEEK